MAHRAVVALLVGVQLLAFAGQWWHGFWPLQVPPLRQPFSWDMFATCIERCEVLWPQPIVVSGRRVTHLGALRAPLEWEVIFDRQATYRALAQESCAQLPPAARVTLRCFLPSGHTVEEVVHCAPR